MSAAGPDVLFVTRKWPPAVGGMETYSARLAQELGERIDLDVMALPGQPNGSAPTKLAMAGFFSRSLVRLVYSPQAKVVHVGDMALWPLGWAAMLTNSGRKLVISAHGRDVSLSTEPGWRARIYRAYLRLGAKLLRKAQVVANSAYIGGLVRDVGFRSVVIVPLATDFSTPDSQIRKHLLFAGRVARSKGLRFLVEQVMPLLPADLQLRVAGPLWEASEGPILADPRVDYLGLLDKKGMAEEFACAAAVLVPSRTSEGFGLTAIEAAACGAYVIASKHSGLSEVVSSAIGLAIEADDAQAWAKAIRRAIAMTDQERRTHGEGARVEIDSRYRWPRVAEATLAIYGLDETKKA